MKAKCSYCYGHGLMAGMWDLGYRRVVERGPSGTVHAAFRHIEAYACDRCGMPKTLPQPPGHGGPANRLNIERKNQKQQ